MAAVVERYEDSWPWVRAASDVADLRFFDPKLPEPCKDSLACALSNKEVWFTLDALRLEPDIWSSASYEDVVLHELGHVWDDWLGGQQWPLIQAEFYEHYAGCRSRGRSNEQLRVELLVDALVIATKVRDGNDYPYSRGGYGYYNADGFGGCLVDGSAPPQHLLAAISAALFNCESAQATDTRLNRQSPGRGSTGLVASRPHPHDRIDRLCQEYRGARRRRTKTIGYDDAGCARGNQTGVSASTTAKRAAAT